MYWVYVLRSRQTGRHYTGSCEDLADRLARHNSGQSKATRHGVPWDLVYQEPFSTRAEAVCRERQLKTGRGRREVDAQLERGSSNPAAGRLKSAAKTAETWAFMVQ